MFFFSDSIDNIVITKERSQRVDRSRLHSDLCHSCTRKRRKSTGRISANKALAKCKIAVAAVNESKELGGNRNAEQMKKPDKHNKDLIFQSFSSVQQQKKLKKTSQLRFSFNVESNQNLHHQRSLYQTAHLNCPIEFQRYPEQTTASQSILAPI